DALLTALRRYIEERRWTKVSASSLKDDVSCFLRTYLPGKRGPASTIEETLDCPLTNLNLVGETGEEDRYRFNNGPKPGLPGGIFAFALVDFWNTRHAGPDTLSVREIVHGVGGPGRVFRLDDDAVLRYLDQVEAVTGGRMAFIDTALVRH